MSVPKCVNCKRQMKKVTNANRMFLGKYIISHSTFYVCGTCGEEYVGAKEYELIRKKIDGIESKNRIPAVHEVMAKVRFFVL